MPSFFNTLAGRLALLQLLILAILPTMLDERLNTVVRNTVGQSFIGHARAYVQSLADELALSDTLDSPSRSIVLLDSVIQGGYGSYAAIDYNGRLLGSSLAETPADVRHRGDSGALGESADHIFALSVPLLHEGRKGILYVGIDEKPSLIDIRAARHQIVVALLLYSIASMIAALALVRVVSKPLTQLQSASRTVARKDPTAQITVDSSMVEIVELTHDLEFMRRELVGTAAQLRTEMQHREIEQIRRTALENQLRHEHRLATVGTFAGGVAHEFNNILLPLFLCAEEALDDVPAGHPARRNLEQILAASERAREIVSKILAFSAPNRLRDPVAVDVALVIGETLDFLRAMVPPDVDLIRSVAAPGERVLGDPTLLSQVILNLCSNALRAMRERGGTLTVSLSVREARQVDAAAPSMAHSVEIRVKDTGPGMTPEVREHIFEPFFTTHDVGDGTGLGLSVVHGIVASMGGVIEVVTAPGLGAEFTVMLPALTAAIPPPVG